MRRLLLLVCLTTFSAGTQAATLCPDGTYVHGNSCRLAPNGSYVSGTQSIQLAPDGTYTDGQQLAPKWNLRWRRRTAHAMP